MSIVLVHGNPETDAIWDDLRTCLDRQDIIALSPPGFGAPVPNGFGATSDDYLNWLAAELENIDQPIDLVGHDWGGGHVMRIAMERPQLIRSWAMDIAGCFDPDYVWHDFAQIWQTPDAGEEAIAQMVGQPLEARVEQFVGLGMTQDVAQRVAAANDQAMGDCILTLYRSAAQPAMTELGQGLGNAKAKPGLVIIPTGDGFTGGEAMARRSAEKAGAQVAVLQDLGHWWMCQDPEQGAQVLRNFFASLD